MSVSLMQRKEVITLHFLNLFNKTREILKKAFVELAASFKVDAFSGREKIYNFSCSCNIFSFYVLMLCIENNYNSIEMQKVYCYVLVKEVLSLQIPSCYNLILCFRAICLLIPLLTVGNSNHTMV